MKRSEMIKLLGDYLYHYDWNNGVSDPKIILDFLENEGMLPPSYSKAHELPGVDSYHVWEPENDSV